MVKKGLNKLIAIVGPTASGKTDLAVFLAKKFSANRGPADSWNGFELISADSRQVYKGMDIGTGKDKSYPQHLIDICDPRQDQYTVAQFQKDAYREIYDIFKRDKIPILVGGTGLYIDAVLKGYRIPKTSLSLRQELEKLNDKELLAQLKSYDPAAYQKIDHHNLRRILRALESSIVNRRPFSGYQAKAPKFEALIIGMDLPRTELYRRIDERVDERIKQGMIEEVENLLKSGVPYEKLQSFGLEYRFISQYLQKVRGSKSPRVKKDFRLSTLDSPALRAEMTQKLKFAIHAFARRQLTWFRRNREIKWIKSYREAESLANKFLS